ncbi:MAG: YdiU family protein [Pseudomonadota bacterium]
MPVNTLYCPSIAHLQLGEAFYTPVEPAAFPTHTLRFRNDRWAARVGLDTLTDEEWVSHFAAFEPLPGSFEQPLALKYHGHQFRHYNPDIGDGRGFLFAQVHEDGTPEGRLLDLATKGSGQTPYSRDGDGRLTLKGGVREILATELLEARGVATSKSLSLIETGEALYRGDEPSPTRSAVLVRLGHSHIRFGTFQRVAFRGETDALKHLVDYAIATYWPQADGAPDPVAAFFGLVCRAVGHQAAEWFAAGFVHGVLNTDNTVITGESFDYGPWRFLPFLDAQFTAAYFDQSGLYAFGRQPGALHWNLQRLADCLLPLSNEAALVEELATFSPAFESRLSDMTRARLGLAPLDHQADTDQADAASEAPDDPLIASFYGALAKTRIGWERAFFDLFTGAREDRRQRSPHAETYNEAHWLDARAAIAAAPVAPDAEAALTSDTFTRDEPVDLLIDDVEAVWAQIAKDDDWSAFDQTIADIRAYGAAIRCPARAAPFVRR